LFHGALVWKLSLAGELAQALIMVARAVLVKYMTISTAYSVKTDYIMMMMALKK